MHSTFTIASGIHEGATFGASDALLVIGSDTGCDVCLSDPGLAPRHAAILSQSGVLSIRRLDGDVIIDERSIETRCVKLDAGTEIVLGASGVRLRLGEPAARPIPAAASVRRGVDAKRALALGVLAAVAVIIVGALSAGSLRASQPPVAKVPDAAALRALLQKERLDRDIEIFPMRSGLQLRGVIAAADMARLQRILDGTSVVNMVIADVDLIEQVREVFRTHGYEANVAYAGHGRVRIDNLDPGHERVRQAAARARTDVAALEDLEFVRLAADPPADLPTYPAKFVKPLSVHIDDELAYLSAGAAARYFVGSELPDGARVRRISERAVLIDRDGQVSWFAF